MIPELVLTWVGTRALFALFLFLGVAAAKVDLFGNGRAGIRSASTIRSFRLSAPTAESRSNLLCPGSGFFLLAFHFVVRHTVLLFQLMIITLVAYGANFYAARLSSLIAQIVLYLGGVGPLPGRMDIYE